MYHLYKLLNIICIGAACMAMTSVQADILPQDISIARYSGNRKAAVSYTFDDGLEEHYTMVFPQLRQRHLQATFCIIGSKVGRDQKGTPCMTWPQLKEMADNGQEITSHGWQHRGVGSLYPEELRHEVQHNDTVIYQHTGVFPRTYFYPGNRKTDAAVAFCSRDRVGTRTHQISIGSKRDTTWLRHWIDDLLESGGWGVGMTHGITQGYDAFRDPQVLWSHLDYVCRLRQQLWIARFCDVAAYIAERDHTRITVKHSRRCTTVKPHTRLNRQLFRMPLTLVVRTGSRFKAFQDGHELPVKRAADGTALLDFNPHGGPVSLRPDQDRSFLSD